MKLRKRIFSFIATLVLVFVPLVSTATTASAATVKTKACVAVSYNAIKGTSKPLNKSYWVTAKAKKNTTFTVNAYIKYSGLNKADAAYTDKQYKKLRFDIYLTEVKTGKTVQAYYYQTNGYTITIPPGGKNYYVTVVSYFSDYKTAKNVNSTSATSIYYNAIIK